MAAAGLPPGDDGHGHGDAPPPLGVAAPPGLAPELKAKVEGVLAKFAAQLPPAPPPKSLIDQVCVCVCVCVCECVCVCVCVCMCVCVCYGEQHRRDVGPRFIG